MEENKKFRISRKIKILILIPAIILSIYFTFFTSIEKIHKVKNSVNPEATKYYVHATTVSVFIFALHDYVFLDFDNPIFIPFYKLRDYFFEKGESLIPKDNSENIVWWEQNYAKIYNLKDSFRIDTSTTIDKLDKDSQLKLRERIYNYIIKFSEYSVKGEIFSLKVDTKDTITTLINAYDNQILEFYDGEGMDRVKNFAQDSLQQERYFKINEILSKIENNNSLIYIFAKQYFLENKIIIEVFRDNLNINLCYKENISDYLDSQKDVYLLALKLQNDKYSNIRKTAIGFIKVSGPEASDSMFHFVLNSMGENCPSDSIVYEKILEIKKELNTGNN